MKIYSKPEYLEIMFAGVTIDETPGFSRDGVVDSIAIETAAIDDILELNGIQTEATEVNTGTQRGYLLEYFSILPVMFDKWLIIGPQIDKRFRDTLESFSGIKDFLLSALEAGDFNQCFKDSLPITPLCSIDDITVDLEGYGINDNPEPTLDELGRVINWVSAIIYGLCAFRGYDLHKPFEGRKALIMKDIAVSFTRSIALRARSYQNYKANEVFEVLNPRVLVTDTRTLELLTSLWGGYYDSRMRADA
jgi:hypothetical protein